MIPQTVTLSLIVLKEKKNIPPLFIVCNSRRLRLREGLQSLAERKGLGLNHASHDVSNGRDKKNISSDFFLYFHSFICGFACIQLIWFVDALCSFRDEKNETSSLELKAFLIVH